tara:strand:+ start:1008 stop:1214 length:207 start_codon:yes stop_codon:yes gene_type:complete
VKCPKCGEEIFSPVGVTEAAKILGLSKRWIYSAYANPDNKNLPKRLAYPGKWLFDVKDLIEWKEENKK